MDELRIGEVTLTSPVYKTAAVIPVAIESMEDHRIFARTIDDAFDRFLHPWNHPDRIRWPEFVPAPRLAAFTARMRERRQRVRDAWSVLRGWDRIATDDDY